ncbi:MAG: carboxypeptidase-like regulatory domain-containing protein [Terracidiphilus sp.]
MKREGNRGVKLLCWFCVAGIACLALSGCPDDNGPRKPDPTKGTVTGLVLCTDTGKPARFATVMLLPSYDPKTAGAGPDKNSIDLDQTITTGLDGRFRLEAVPPGDYYAFATLDGYIDPTLAVDENRLGSGASEREKLIDEIDQWKDHLVKLTVAAQHVTDINVSIDRGAEIDGTMSYDDSSPAIGIRFAVLRKTAQDHWIKIGSNGDDGWPSDVKSDGRGRYSIADLPEGEYKVCALLPVKDEDASPKFCYGGGFRIDKSEPVKVSAGETHTGVDIVLPLDGLFTVAGNITAGTDAHAPSQATVHLLYADDREEARQTAMLKDGSFSFDYVPAGSYILQVTNAQDIAAGATAQVTGGSNGGGQNGDGSGAAPQVAPQIHKYMDKETSLSVQDDMNDVLVTLVEPPPPQQASQ